MKNNPIPQGNYRPAVRYQNFVFTAGMTPRKDGVLLFSGSIPPDADPADYRDAVRQATDNALTAVSNCLEPGEEIAQVLSLTVYLNSDPAFSLHSKIADHASGYLREMLGDIGIGARTAVGTSSLPGQAPVEVAIVVAVK